MGVDEIVPGGGTAGATQATGNTMQPGQVLNPGTEIASASGRYRFCYQGDGNLVLYNGGVAIWASNTAGKPAGVCVMQGDGNLVIYTPSGQPVWASNTMTAGSHLIAQDDGNVVIYAPGNRALWATNTQVPTGPQATGNAMQPGQVLSPDTEIVSVGGRYHFRYQSDGNLVLYNAGIAIWASNTAGRLPGVCIMQGDGNLVIYIPGGHPVWASNTMAAGSHLIAQDDGNVVIYAPSNQALWATNTVAVGNVSLTEQHQQQTEWCWAATTVSITLFYDPQSTWTQCALVNKAFGQTTCCQSGSTTACNQPWYPDQALTITGHLGTTTNGAATLNTVVNEILAKHPISIAIDWTGGGGHNPAISGFDRTNAASPVIDVQDPWYGASTQDFKTFPGNYQGGATWGTTYTTR